MAGSRGGRPKAGDGKGGTRGARVYEDLYDMIYWIQQAEGVSMAALLDPLLRPQIVARYNRRKEAIDVLKKTRGEETPPGRKRPQG